MTTYTITGDHPSGVTVSSGFSAVYLHTGSTVEGSGVDVKGHASVSNYGAIDANTTAGVNGIYLAVGGTVKNVGTGNIYGFVGLKSTSAVGFGHGYVNNYGAIGGYYDGIELGNGGSVKNSGDISGGHYGVDISGGPGTVINSGTIFTFSPGAFSFGPHSAVKIDYGYIKNTGTMYSSAGGIYSTGAAVVTNTGTILGAAGGAYLSLGSLLTNGSATDTQAEIASEVTGVSIAGGAVRNFGTILGGSDLGSAGAWLAGGDYLKNGSSSDHVAFIEGGSAVAGIGVDTVANFGTLQGTDMYLTQAGVALYAGYVINGSTRDTTASIEGYNGVRFSAAGTVQNFGVIQAYGDGVTFTGAGQVINGSPGSHAAMIEGYVAVDAGFGGGAGTVVNYGVLEGADGPNGVAVILRDGGQVTNGSTSDPTALIESYDGVQFRGAAGVLTNLADITVAGVGVSFTAAGAVVNGAATDQTATIDASAAILGARSNTLTVTNFGTVRSTAINNAGVELVDGGAVTNGSGGDKAALITSPTGVRATYAAATVVNFATIEGLSAYGVQFYVGGTITNGGGTDRTALIEGSNGVQIAGYAGTVKNFATIAGTGGTGTYGVALTGGGYLENGSQTNGTAIIQGYGGVLFDAVGQNYGTILAQGDFTGAGLNATGGRFYNGSAAHTGALIEGLEGVEGSGAATVVNFGTIDGVGGTAVSLTSASADLTVEAGSVFIGAVFGGGGTLELDTGTGTLTGLLSNAGDVTVSGSMAKTTFQGFGTVQVDTPASFTLSGGGKVAAGQAFVDYGLATTTGTLTSAGALTFAGTLAGTGTLTISGGKAAFNTGTSLTIARIIVTGVNAAVTIGAANLTYAGVIAQDAGTISAGAGDKVSFTGTNDVFLGTFAGAGTVAFAGGTDALEGTTFKGANVQFNTATVTLEETILNNSAMTVNASNLTIAVDGATLTGTGTIALSNLATNKITGVASTATLTNVSNKITGAGQLGAGKMTLVNQAGGTIDANQTAGLTIDTGAATIANAGLIESAGSGLLTIKSAVNNTGTLYASGGTLIANGAVTGTGKVTIANGLADFVSTFTENVAFTATSTGTLELSKSATYTGSISGFSKTGANFLDLADIAFTAGTTKATYSGTTTSGVLTVTDGTHTAKINLTGNYTTSTFVLASDGHGGTLIHDPAKAAATPAPAPKSPPFWTGPAPIVPFIGAMAGFGASSASAASSSLMAPLTKHAALASPHRASA